MSLEQFLKGGEALIATKKALVNGVLLIKKQYAYPLLYQYKISTLKQLVFNPFCY